MPPVATGSLFGRPRLKGIGLSGDGDSASIGMGQFKHIVRRNVNMIYIVENNGVYGLTKGQFSATAEVGLTLKHQGTNPLHAGGYLPGGPGLQRHLCGALLRRQSHARSRNLLKAALSHNGIAVLDIVSPCVTFNNHDDSTKSYSWGKSKETALMS